MSVGRHGLGRDYAGIGPLDGYSSGEKKFKNNSINSCSSIRRARTEEGPQMMTKNMEDAFLNSTMSSMQSKVDFKGKGTLHRGIHCGSITIDEGGKIDYTDKELHLDPEVYYATTKRKARKLKKNKTKTGGGV